MHLRRNPIRPLLIRTLPQRSTFYRSFTVTASPSNSILGLEYGYPKGTGALDLDSAPYTARPNRSGWKEHYQAHPARFPLGIPRGPTTFELKLRQQRQKRDRNYIKTYPCTFPSARTACKDPLAAVTQRQLSVLDPTGVRTRLFSKTNLEGAKVGDILLVRSKDGDPFAGVCINIRRRGVDTAILLRDQATRVGVEMWFKVYSPNVEGIEVVQRRVKRARRARLYYMRKPKHDIGSVANIVTHYLRQRSALRSGGATKGRDANAGKRKKKR